MSEVKKYQALVIPPSEHTCLVPDEANRPISRRRVDKIKDSVRSIGEQTTPIIVVPHKEDGKYRIISGHHRHAALMEMEHPIKAVCDPAFEGMDRNELTAVMVEGTKTDNWGAVDAMRRRANWNDDYAWVEDVVDNGPLSLSFLYQCILFPERGGDTTSEKDLFIDGELELTPEIKEHVKSFQRLVEDTMSLKDRTWKMNTMTVRASKGLFNVTQREGFDRERWLHAVELYGLMHCSAISEWEEHFLDTYNANLKNNNRI